ncbi:hypothetical protein [Peribacillus sp. SCS-155]|uniref:hypothetical protein n=1 Tax=Peribacillus sedimenti TaxID=3115297 RepID=UPI00390642FC
MEQSIIAEVDLDSLENQNNILGNIYFVVDYYRYFPEYGWSDFVIIILSWWIKSIKGLIVSEVGSSYEFDFMDGSPVVLAKKIDTKNAEMLFCSTRSKIEFRAVCNIVELRESLLSVSRKVLRTVKRNDWNNDETEQLNDLIISLQHPHYNI